MIIISGRGKNLSKRFFANFFDYTIFFFLFFVYIFLVGDQDNEGTYRVTGLKAFVIPIIWLIYFPLVESVTGQTIGKRAFSLQIVDLRGETPSVAHCFLRRMTDIFELSFLGVPGILMINHSQKNQRFGDMIAGTTVIRTEAICRFCNIHLELTPKEVLDDTFLCPSCNEQN
jgi:uncharacterized RDD family membrane protein YckC